MAKPNALTISLPKEDYPSLKYCLLPHLQPPYDVYVIFRFPNGKVVMNKEIKIKSNMSIRKLIKRTEWRKRIDVAFS